MAEEQAHTAATAGTTVSTVADGAHHVEPTLLGLDAEGWVYTGVFIFIVLAVVVGKVPALIAKALDDRIAGVKRQLAQAEIIIDVQKKLSILLGRPLPDSETNGSDE